MMEYYYTWGLLLPVWLVCGLIGYSMLAGFAENRYGGDEPRDVIWRDLTRDGMPAMIIAGPASILGLLMAGWTEKDGMWL